MDRNRLFRIFLLTALIGSSNALTLEARILPETLVLPQCEFYPHREQDRGYLYRYADQPLFIDPDLPEDPPNAAFETRRHRYWGEWFSQADWNACEQLGKDCGFDGYGFFPRPHRDRYWDAMEKSPVRGFYEVPISSTYVNTYPDLDQWFGSALKSSRAYRWNGKVLILSYRHAHVFKPAQIKERVDRMRQKYGDTFLFVCDVSRFLANTTETAVYGHIRPETEAKWKDELRAYLRVCDGVIVGDAFTISAQEGPARTRVFNSAHYTSIVRILKETLNEPEFCGKKLLGLGASIAHENTTRQFWTTSEDGLRTLTESLRIAASADPDVILLPEWDEFNENTCVGPTLMNGLSVKRIIHTFQTKLKHRALKPLPNDDVTKPNLIVSYRRNVSPGERLMLDVLNIPDGSREGGLSVSAALEDESGRTLVSFPAQEGYESRFKHFRFPVDSAALAEKARAPRVRINWRTEDGSGEISEGLAPIDLEPANGWCVKEIHQPLRDLAPMQKAEVTLRADGRLAAKLQCDEPIRYAFVSGNGVIQRVVGDSQSAASLFVEDDAHVVFQVFGSRPGTLDKKSFAYRVKGCASAEWFDRHGIQNGLEFMTDWIASIGDPYFLRIPRTALETAELEMDFGTFYQGNIPLSAAFEQGACMASGKNGIQFAVTRFRRQTRYPSAANAKTLDFTVSLDGDRASMAYYVQVVTMGGKTWRSRPVVVEPASAPAKMRVFSATAGKVREITLPAVRIPQIVYDPNPAAGVYLPTKDRLLHFASVLGGYYSGLTLWNRTSTSKFDLPEGFSPKFDQITSAAPRLEREQDGGYSLAFDADDFISVPWEAIPQNAAYRFSMDVCPTTVEGSFDFLISKRLLNLRVEDGVLILSVCGRPNVRTGLHLKAGAWQQLVLEHQGDRFLLSLDGQRFETEASLPASFMSPVALQFRGRVRNIVIDQASRR